MSWLQAIFQITVVFDMWTLYVLHHERHKYCELPLRRFLGYSLLFSTPCTLLVHKVGKRASVRKAFVLELLILGLSFIHLLSGTLLITQVEICPYSSPLTWKTSFLMLGSAWSGITISSLLMITTAFANIIKCNNHSDT